MSEILVDYKLLYKKIMEIDPYIRFVTIVDANGRLMYGGQKEGLRNYLSPENQRLSIRHAIDAWQLRNRFSEQIGKGKYAVAEYEKIKRITIPIDSRHIIYMTTEPEANHTNIVKIVKKMIGSR